MIATLVYDETDMHVGTYHNGYRADFHSGPRGAVDEVRELIIDFAWLCDNGGLPANLGDIPQEARLGD